MKMMAALFLMLLCIPETFAGPPTAQAKVKVALALATPAPADVFSDSNKQEVKPRDGCCGCEQTGRCQCQYCMCDLSYASAWKEAKSKDKPLVVFVNMRPRPMPGCVVCRRDDCPGVTGQVVMVGTPAIDEDDWTELRGPFTDEVILAKAKADRVRAKTKRDVEKVNSYHNEGAAPFFPAVPKYDYPTGPLLQMPFRAPAFGGGGVRGGARACSS